MEKSENPSGAGPSAGKSGDKSRMLMLVGVIVLVVFVVVVIVMTTLSRKSSSTADVPKAQQISGEISDIALNEAYENPFDRDTQYSNPFNEFKSPFESLR